MHIAVQYNIQQRRMFELYLWVRFKSNSNCNLKLGIGLRMALGFDRSVLEFTGLACTGCSLFTRDLQAPSFQLITCIWERLLDSSSLGGANLPKLDNLKIISAMQKACPASACSGLRQESTISPWCFSHSPSHRALRPPVHLVSPFC